MSRLSCAWRGPVTLSRQTRGRCLWIHYRETYVYIYCLSEASVRVNMGHICQTGTLGTLAWLLHYLDAHEVTWRDARCGGHALCFASSVPEARKQGIMMYTASLCEIIVFWVLTSDRTYKIHVPYSALRNVGKCLPDCTVSQKTLIFLVTFCHFSLFLYYIFSLCPFFFSFCFIHIFCFHSAPFLSSSLYLHSFLFLYIFQFPVRVLNALCKWNTLFTLTN